MLPSDTPAVPPLPGAPRHDLVLLIRTVGVDDLDRVRRADDVAALGGEEILVGTNAGRFGETEADPDAVFLLNHFTVAGDADPVEAWRGLTGWYASTIGVDNSTALRATQPSGFALVNYVRLPSPPPLFLLRQVLRPSFHRVVRGTLRAYGMRAAGHLSDGSPAGTRHLIPALRTAGPAGRAPNTAGRPRGSRAR